MWQEPSRRQARHHCVTGTLPSPSWTLPLGRNPPVTKLDTTVWPEPYCRQAGHCHLAGTLPSPSWTLLRGWNHPVTKLDTTAWPEPSRRQAGHYCVARTLPSPSWTLLGGWNHPVWTLLRGRNPPIAKLDTTAWLDPSRRHAICAGLSPYMYICYHDHTFAGSYTVGAKKELTFHFRATERFVPLRSRFVFVCWKH